MPVLVFRRTVPGLCRWAIVVCELGMLAHTFAGARGGGANIARVLGPQAVVISWVFAAIACFPVYLRPDGVRGYDFYGLYRTLRWAEIVRVRRVSVLGSPYLVATDGSREVWVPLYLPDMARFARAVRACAGDGHPLAVALREYRADVYPATAE